MRYVYFKYFILLCLLFGSREVYSQDEESISVLFWNLENFFDYKYDGEGEPDKEFSPLGNKRWNKRKFYTKCNAIAKTLMWISDEYRNLPDVVGFAEIENSFVLRILLKHPALKRSNYAFVHYDSSDPRGIDVALLYNKNRFEYLYSEAYPIISQGDTLKTRDILLVTLKHKNRGVYNFIVNHHPSKYSGAERTQFKRELAMKTLLKVSQETFSTAKTIAMGDFNDGPDAPQFSILNDYLYTKTEKFFGQDVGTIRYEGRWELIDFFLTSKDVQSEMFILSPPFLLEWDNTHSGFKPLRTYSGPRYKGGVSDHLPILLRIF